MCTGDPVKPVDDAKWAGIKFLTIKSIETIEFKVTINRLKLSDFFLQINHIKITFIVDVYRFPDTGRIGCEGCSRCA